MLCCQDLFLYRYPILIPVFWFSERISNQNRIRSRDDTTLSQFSVDISRNVESYVVDTIEGANDVIASAGPGGSNYFDILHDSKRQKALNPGVTVDANIEFMKDIGWFDNEEDIREVASEAARQSSILADNKTNTGVPRKGKHDNITTQLQGKSSATNTRTNPNIDSMALYDPKEPPKTNPYYNGAAIKGVLDISQAKKKDSKSDRVYRQQNSAVDRRTGTGNKTHIYRK